MSKQQHQKAPETAPLFTLAEAPISIEPQAPNRGTRAWVVLYDLVTLGTLNQHDYLQHRGNWRLSAGVKALDYLGWKFMVSKIMDYHPKRERKIAFYTLPEDFKALAWGKLGMGELQ